jgi:hypothetical protein
VITVDPEQRAPLIVGCVYVFRDAAGNTWAGRVDSATGKPLDARDPVCLGRVVRMGEGEGRNPTLH